MQLALFTHSCKFQAGDSGQEQRFFLVTEAELQARLCHLPVQTLAPNQDMGISLNTSSNETHYPAAQKSEGVAS